MRSALDVGRWAWRQVRTAPHSDGARKFFTVTHPFHPWHGRRFELIDLRRRWGQWRVYYLTEEGRTAFFPAGWTDAGLPDPFVQQAQGRAIARVEDLLRLARLRGNDVKEIKPNM